MSELRNGMPDNVLQGKSPRTALYSACGEGLDDCNLFISRVYFSLPRAERGRNRDIRETVEKEAVRMSIWSAKLNLHPRQTCLDRSQGESKGCPLHPMFGAAG